MGGHGSGTWSRYGKKTTVEESLTLAVRHFRSRFAQNESGEFVWTWTSGRKSSIGYLVTRVGHAVTVRLHYRCGDSDAIVIPVEMQTTPSRIGGPRWWFTCPLIVRGVACNRRVGTLHLPPGSNYFGCRTCHRLTYVSCQEAHQEDRLAAQVAAMTGGDLAVCKLMFRRRGRRG